MAVYKPLWSKLRETRILYVKKQNQHFFLKGHELLEDYLPLPGDEALQLQPGPCADIELGPGRDLNLQ